MHYLCVFMQKINRYSIATVAVVLLVGCGKVRNSSTNDPNVYGSGVTGSASFLSARGVLAINCMSCHANWSSYSEQDYRNKFLVVQGDPVNSLIYYRIRGNDVGIPGDMPDGGRPNLSTEDMKKIKDWIATM